MPATCGELLQGVDCQGPLLVSLPIDRWATVRVMLTAEPVLSVTPTLPRAVAALQLAIDRAGWRGGATVRLGGEIPRARGMGSSTADVAGVIGGVCAAAGLALAPGELVRLMTSVEPSDSSPLPGLWAIDHVGGRRVAFVGALPRGWRLVAVDSGAAVSTAAAHRSLGAGPPLPVGTRAALAGAEGAALAGLATASAARNQDRLPHPAFALLCRLAGAVGGLGVCTAHSGSLCAVICGSDAVATRAAAALRGEGLRPIAWRAAAPGMRVRVGAEFSGARHAHQGRRRVPWRPACA